MLLLSKLIFSFDWCDDYFRIWIWKWCWNWTIVLTFFTRIGSVLAKRSQRFFALVGSKWKTKIDCLFSDSGQPEIDFNDASPFCFNSTRGGEFDKHFLVNSLILRLKMELHANYRRRLVIRPKRKVFFGIEFCFNFVFEFSINWKFCDTTWKSENFWKLNHNDFSPSFRLMEMNERSETNGLSSIENDVNRWLPQPGGLGCFEKHWILERLLFSFHFLLLFTRKLPKNLQVFLKWKFPFSPDWLFGQAQTNLSERDVAEQVEMNGEKR